MHSLQISAVEKIGNIYIPGDTDLPSFQSSQCIQHLEKLLEPMPQKDKEDLGMLLWVFAFLPRPFVYLFILFIEKISDFKPLPGLGIFRLIRLGLRGLIFSLYYGHADVLKRMEYSVSVVLDK